MSRVRFDDVRSPLLGGGGFISENRVEPKRQSRRLIIALSLFTTCALAIAALSYKHVKLRTFSAPSPCTRTLLVDYSSWNYGFAASLFAMIHGTIFAETYGYTVLFGRENSVYGSYLDYFNPAPLTCVADESLYDANACMSHASPCQATHGAILDNYAAPAHDANRLLYQRHGVFGMNTWLTRNTSFADLDLSTLPKLDSSRPLAAQDSLPAPMLKQFDVVESAFQRHFGFNAIMNAKINAARHEIAALARSGSPIIGVHYRGGDKLGFECTPSAIMSCGNVTMHAEAAWQAYREQYGDARPTKPTMVLLSAEADALDKFRADPIGSRFIIVEAPNHRRSASYSQGSFNAEPMNDRIEDTRLLLANLAVLGREHALIVSSNSNLGRVAMLLAGKERIQAGFVRAFDLYFFPTLFKPIWPDCAVITSHGMTFLTRPQVLAT